MPNTTFVCELSEIDVGFGGRFGMSELKEISIKKSMRVIIRGYGQIVAGELKVFKAVH